MLTPRLILPALLVGALLTGPVRAEPETLTRKVSFTIRPGQDLEPLIESGRWEVIEVRGDQVAPRL